MMPFFPFNTTSMSPTAGQAHLQNKRATLSVVLILEGGHNCQETVQSSIGKP